MYIQWLWKPSSLVVEVGLAPTRIVMQLNSCVFYRNGYPFSLPPPDFKYYAGQYSVANSYSFEFKAKNIDGRAKVQPDEKSIKIGGGWVFGQNVSFPIEFLEKINGYDEFLARRGCEDCNIGVRLEIAGYSDKIFYNKNCLIIEDERMHWCDVNPVDDIYPKRIWKSDYEKHVAVSEFMLKTMNEIEHRNLYVEKNFKTIDTNFNLLQEKELYQNTGQFKPVGDCDYFDFDGENISQI